MNSLVTIAEVRHSLRFNDTTDDVRLSLLIEAASNAVLRYMKSDGDEFRNSVGIVVPGNVPGDIKWAVITLAGILERNVDVNDDKILEPDHLPAPVEALLFGLRDPTLA